MTSTIVVAHGDADGVCSASLIRAALGEVDVFFSHPAGLLKDVREASEAGYSRMVIVDISLSQPHINELTEVLGSLKKKGVEIVYIDHHPWPFGVGKEVFPGDVYHMVGVSASELTYHYFRGRLEGDIERVALFGAIADYEDVTPWVIDALKRWDKRDVYYEAGILSLGLEGSRRDYDFKRIVVKLLSENTAPSTIDKLVEKAIEESRNNEEMRLRVKENVRVVGRVAYVVNPGGSLGRAAIYAYSYAGAVVGIAVEERKDGHYNMSLRTWKPNVDLNRILRRITPVLGGTGGGHRAAAGARIPIESFPRFLEMLDEALGGGSPWPG